MLKLQNPDRFLPSENIYDYLSRFPILCAESAKNESEIIAFSQQLLLETAALPSGFSEDVFNSIHEGVVADIVTTAQNFVKSVIDFFKKLIDRLKVSFSTNAESIDKWLEKIKPRLNENMKNAPRFDYEGYKWSPSKLDKFRENTFTHLPDPVSDFVKGLEMEESDFKKTLEIEKRREQDELLDTKEKKKAAQEEVKNDEDLSKSQKKEIKKDIKATSEKDSKDSEFASKQLERISEYNGRGKKAELEKDSEGDDLASSVEKHHTADFEATRKLLLKALLNNEDETKGFEELRKEIMGTDKVTIKGFNHLSIDAMMKVIADYKKVSDKFIKQYTLLLESYNTSESKLSTMDFSNDAATDKIRDKTKNYSQAKTGQLRAILGELRWSQGFLNNCTKQAMTLHKEMVNDFMKTITTFAMTNF